MTVEGGPHLPTAGDARGLHGSVDKSCYHENEPGEVQPCVDRFVPSCVRAYARHEAVKIILPLCTHVELPRWLSPLQAMLE